jgi:DNA-binding SARP family transcriptional activator/tetratricopeptide (TPR) repeat protein
MPNHPARRRHHTLGGGTVVLQFGVLGPLRVIDGSQTLPLGARNQRIVLATLLCRPNRSVAAGALIDAVWDHAPPRTAAKNLQVYIHHLRRLLGDDRIVWQPPGYTATVDPAELDAQVFHELVTQGRQAIAEGRLRHGRDLLAASLELWRGPAFADLSGVPALQATVARLTELQLSTLEDRLDADLALGGHKEVAAEIGSLTAEHPLRERLRRQQMVALYRCGRTAEALQVYHDVRQLLADEFGVEPSEALQEVYVSIVRSIDPGPAPTESATPAGGPPRQPADKDAPAVPRQLPADVAGFSGREPELDELRAMVPAEQAHGTRAIVVALAGTAGVGKTALAVHWAHEIADRFPDGQLFIDLRGFATGPPMRPVDALAILLRSLGVTSDQIPLADDEAAALYRSWMSTRRMLVLLDNAHSAEQVRPLLPGSPRCLVVVTSRKGLSGLVAMQGARRLTVDVLRSDGAMVLLTALLGEERGREEPGAITDLARVCGYLPLALRVAAAHLLDNPHQTIASYVADLQRGDRLDLLATPEDERSAVRTVFGQSYRGLRPTERRLFRLLGLAPGDDFDVEAAVAMAAISQAEATALLRRLVDAHLVTPTVGGRFTLHDLLRDYAAGLAAAAEAAEAVTRLLDWYVDQLGASARAAYPTVVHLPAAEPSGTFPDRERALAWLDSQRASLLAAVPLALRYGHSERAWRIVDGLRGYLFFIRAPHELLSVTELALPATQSAGDARAEAAVRIACTHALVMLLDLAGAGRHARIAAERARMAGWWEGYAQALNMLGSVQLNRGMLDDTIRYSRRALAAYRRVDHNTGQAIALGRLGLACLLRGRLIDSLTYQQQAMDLHRASAGRHDQATTLTNLAETLHLLGRRDEALQSILEALRIHAELGHPASECSGFICLAMIYRDHGRLDEAETAAASAWQILAGNDHALDRTSARHVLGTIAAAKGDDAVADGHFEQALQSAAALQIRHPEAEIRTSYADALRLRGQLDPAFEHAHRALELAEAAGYDLIRARACAALADIYVDIGDRSTAGDHARRAMDLFQRSGHRDGVIRAGATIARATEAANQA